MLRSTSVPGWNLEFHFSTSLESRVPLHFKIGILYVSRIKVEFHLEIAIWPSALHVGSSHLQQFYQDTKHFMWKRLRYRCELCGQVFPHWVFLTRLAASDTFDSEGTTLDAFETCKTCNEEVQGLLQAGYLLEVEDA